MNESKQAPARRIGVALLLLAVAPRPGAAVTIPAGTVIEVKLLEGLSSESNQSDDPINSVLAKDLVIGGRAVLPAGTPIRGRLVEVHSSSPKRFKYFRKTRMSLELQNVQVGGRPRPITTSVTEFVRQWDGSVGIEVYQAGYLGGATGQASAALLTDSADDQEKVRKIAAAVGMMKKIFLNRRQHVVFEPGDVLGFFLQEALPLTGLPAQRMAANQGSRPSLAPNTRAVPTPDSLAAGTSTAPSAPAPTCEDDFEACATLADLCRHHADRCAETPVDEAILAPEAPTLRAGTPRTAAPALADLESASGAGNLMRWLAGGALGLVIVAVGLLLHKTGVLSPTPEAATPATGPESGEGPAGSLGPPSPAPQPGAGPGPEADEPVLSNDW